MVYHIIYLFYAVAFYNVIITAAVNEDEDRVKIEERYLTRRVENGNQMNALCLLPTEEKFALCEKLLERFPIESSSLERIIFNKAAAYNRTSNCVKTTLTLTSESELKDQDMFPCYGQHDPMRTGYGVDEFFDVYFIFQGPVDNSIFVAQHLQTMNYDYYVLDKVVEQLDIDFVEKVAINEKVYEIEKSYLRELLVATEIATPDPICVLSTEEKLALCKKLLESADILDGKYTVVEKAFNTYSVKCVNEPLKFIYMIDYNKKGIYQNMYPCYGHYSEYVGLYSKIVATSHFFISNGHRKNSVILYDNFTKNDIFPAINFYRFYENIKIDTAVLKIQNSAGSSLGFSTNEKEMLT